MIISKFPTVSPLLIFHAAVQLTHNRPLLHAVMKKLGAMATMAFLICFFGGIAIFLNIQAFGPGGPSGAPGRVTVGGAPVALPVWLQWLAARLFISIFALIFDPIIATAIWHMIKAPFQRRTKADTQANPG